MSAYFVPVHFSVDQRAQRPVVRAQLCRDLLSDQVAPLVQQQVFLGRLLDRGLDGGVAAEHLRDLSARPVDDEDDGDQSRNQQRIHHPLTEVPSHGVFDPHLDQLELAIRGVCVRGFRHVELSFVVSKPEPCRDPIPSS